jgi:tetratricopeptide (TPR) repeat protein
MAIAEVAAPTDEAPTDDRRARGRDDRRRGSRPERPDRIDRIDRIDRARSGERPDPGQSRPVSGQDATPQRLYNEGMRLQVAGDTNGAIARFKAAISANRDFAAAYRGLGLAYERQGRGDRAARAFRTYLSLAGDAPDAAAIRTRLARLDTRSSANVPE